LWCISAALVGREPSGLLEVRWRHGDGMKRRVYRVGDEFRAAAAAAAIIELSTHRRLRGLRAAAPARLAPLGRG
jgi:hypothetical protein